MTDLYTKLQVSPRKKRALPDSDDDTNTVTPKRLRLALPTPPSTERRGVATASGTSAGTLPDHLLRLYNTHCALQHALSHALATCAVSPTSDTGIVLAVVNHISVATYTGLSTRFDSDELRRLCWLWEWDSKTLPAPARTATNVVEADEAENPFLATPKRQKVVADEEENPFFSTPKASRRQEKKSPGPKPVASTSAHGLPTDDDENPFLATPKASRQADKKQAASTPAKYNSDSDGNPFTEEDVKHSSSKDWTRGGMGIVVSASTHYAKGVAKRVPAYGIGVEVEMDIDKGMGGGMAAIARWTSSNETRKNQLHKKLERWLELHPKDATATIPMANLPELSVPSQPSNLTRLLASASPKAPASLAILQTPSSPPRSPSKYSAKLASPTKSSAFPFPSSSRSTASSPVKGTLSKGLFLFPKTPSARQSRAELASTLFGPRTPSSSPTRSNSSGPSVPSTPVHQRGGEAETAPATPSSSRRNALYERIRQKSLTASPTKSSALSQSLSPSKLSKDQLLKMSHEETRRRCLLGRLGGVAESIWMFFSGPSASSSMTPTMRKRRMMPVSEVANAILKSSPVPISLAEAQESISLLTTLCPFFLKAVDIAGEEWLEMSGNRSVGDDQDIPDTPTKAKALASPSRGTSSPVRRSASPTRARSDDDSVRDMLTRSPRRIKNEGGGLREVRERIRRELELNE